jgi:hypothetical protein
MAVQKPQVTDLEQADWTLNADQMTFMLQHHNYVEQAYADEDMDALHALADSEAYKAAFGDMSWDEAYDRYETMIEESDADA